MAVFFNKSTPNFSTQFGKSFADEIGSGFQALANMKMQDYAARQAQTRQNEQKKMLNDHLVKMLGPEYEGIGYQDPQVISSLVRAQQQKQSGQALSQMLAGLDSSQNNGQNNQQPVQPGREQEGQPIATQPQQGMKVPSNATAADVKYINDLKMKNAKLGLDERKAMASEKKAEAQLDLAKQTGELNKEKFAEKKQVEPRKYMHDLHKEFKLNEQINTKAKNLLKMAEHAKSKYPGWFKGPLNYLTQNMFERDPEIRKLGDQLNELVPLLSSQKMGGKPSVYALTQEQLSKANISQPYETVIGILNDVVRSSELGMQPYRYGKSKKNKDNTYPTDIEDIVGNFDMFVQNPFSVSPAGIIKPGKKVTFNGVTKVATADGWEDVK